MRTFREDLERSVEFHGHLCSGQCLGVRMAHMGMRLLGLDNERDTKKIMVYTECNRCPSDSILISTGCRIGKRTYYFADLGKVAATFLNLETGKAVRVVRTNHRYSAEGEDMVAFYEALPEEEFLEAKEVVVKLGEGDYPGPPVKVVVCEECGEEVMDMRHVVKDGKTLCKACAKEITYYG